VTVAISTSGRVPALSRKLKDELERVFSEAGLATFAAELSELREQTPRHRRREILDRALAGVRLMGLKIERRDS
jgi:siroheme synthase (precorrin-2 oxidase/ferrochelatase)